MSEGVGEVHVDVHADSSGLAREVETAAERAAAGAQIEMDAELTRGAIRHLQREAARAARAARSTVEFEADTDFMGIIGEARRAARLARQRVVFEAHLQTRGLAFDRAIGQFRHEGNGAIATAEELGQALEGMGRNANGAGGAFGGMAQTIENSIAAFSARAVTQITAFGLLIGSIIPYVIALVAALGSLIAVAIQAAGSVVSVGVVFGALAGGFLVAKIGSMGLSDAFKAQQKALDELNRTGKVSKKTQEELDAAMKHLAPSARNFVKEVEEMRPAFDGLRLAVQQRLFLDLGDMFEATAKETIPLLTAGMVKVAGVINDAALSFLNFARSAEGARIITGIFDTIAAVLPPTLKALGQFALGIGNLFIGAGPAGVRFAEMLQGLGEDFAKWTKKISDDGSLDRFLTRAQTALEEIGRLAKSAAKFVLALIDGGGAGGEGLKLIEDIRSKLDEFTTWLNDPANQPTIQKFWDDVNKNLGRMWDIISGINWSQVFSDLGGLATALYILAKALETLINIGAFSNVFSTIEKLATTDWGSIDFGANITKSFGGILPAITGFLNNIAPGVGTAFATWMTQIGAEMASGNFDWGWFAYSMLLPLPAAIIQALTTFGPDILVGFENMFLSGGQIDWAVVAYTLLFPLPAAILAILTTFAPGVGEAFLNMFTANPPDWLFVVYTLLAPLPSAIVVFIVSMGPQIAGAFTTAFSTVPNAVQTVITMILGPFAGLAARIIVTSGNFYFAFYNWLVTGVTAAGIVIGSLVAKFFGLAGKLIANAGDMYGAAMGWFSGLTRAAQVTIGILFSLFGGLAGALVASMGAFNLPTPTIGGAAKGMIAGAAHGIQVTRGPQLRWIGEAGPEAVVPLNPNQPLDPAVNQFLKSVAADRWGTPKDKERVTVPPQINVSLPTGDPEAAAMAVYNRLVFEGAI